MANSLELINFPFRFVAFKLRRRGFTPPHTRPPMGYKWQRHRATISVHRCISLCDYLRSPIANPIYNDLLYYCANIRFRRFRAKGLANVSAAKRRRNWVGVIGTSFRPKLTNIPFTRFRIARKQNNWLRKYLFWVKEEMPGPPNAKSGYVFNFQPMPDVALSDLDAPIYSFSQ